MFDTSKIKGMIITKGWDIKDFIKHIKIGKNTFYNMLNNKSNPAWENVLKLAIALDCKIDDLLIDNKKA